ncbi:Protein FAM192A [Biomphalaria pfeifferi]|uniref:Protein FAM192A n=1 Tax=Biomphalaria pfeifferi TaxID=112525 RepID=A0AAD8FK15_BIOPF|nr:Protein FAM192A [Biomphalaria pfeifferi]
MAKLIYAIKIYLFRHQKEIFSLTAKEESQLKRFVQFGALLYTKSWIQAPCAAEAPGDLLLWKNLQQYQSIDHDISIAAQKILQNHMWYLSDETVSLVSDMFEKDKQRINDLRVVNDTAERGVKLFEDYNRLLTKNEKEKQFILQVVEANRKVIPAQTTKKSVICAVSV